MIFYRLFILYRPAGFERHCGDRTPQASHTKGFAHGTGPQDRRWQKRYCRTTASATTSSTATTAKSSLRCAHTKDPVAQVRIDLKFDFYKLTY